MYAALQQDLPNAEIHWVMRSLGPRALQSSQFSNEMYYPSFVDTVYGATPQGREEIRREMHRTNYSGVEPDLLRHLYAERYLNQLTDQDRTRIVMMAELVGGTETEDGVLLELLDRVTGEVSRLERDLVFLGTGFSRGMPWLVRQLMTELGVANALVSRNYRLLLDEPSAAACYLQGMNEDSHGVGDSLFSVIADRTAATVRDILTDRASGVPRLVNAEAVGGS
jgi:L-ornithine N5-oxygenase